MCIMSFNILLTDLKLKSVSEESKTFHEIFHNTFMLPTQTIFGNPLKMVDNIFIKFKLNDKSLQKSKKTILSEDG